MSLCKLLSSPKGSSSGNLITSLLLLRLRQSDLHIVISQVIKLILQAFGTRDKVDYRADITSSPDSISWKVLQLFSNHVDRVVRLLV